MKFSNKRHYKLPVISDPNKAAAGELKSIFKAKVHFYYSWNSLYICKRWHYTLIYTLFQ